MEIVAADSWLVMEMIHIDLLKVISDHPYEGRTIGQAATANGKKVVEYEVPEYKNKKCLSCKGKFNVKSRYQVCKLCDQLIHVNNHKRCLKMRNYVKDKDFVCFKC